MKILANVNIGKIPRELLETAYRQIEAKKKKGAV